MVNFNEEKTSYSLWNLNLNDLKRPKKDVDNKVKMEIEVPESTKINYTFRDILISSDILSGCYASGYAKFGKTEVIAYLDTVQFVDDTSSAEQKIVKFKLDADFKSELIDIPRIFYTVLREPNRTIKYKVNINVKNNDGGLLAATVLAVNIALMKASIQLSDIVVAVTIGIIKDTEEVVVDPDLKTLEKCCATIHYGICPNLNMVVLLDQVGSSTKYNNKKLRDLGHRGCMVLKDKIFKELPNLFKADSQ
ncbi:Exoribonuclease, phosphorolytic domain 1 and Exoribonuclease, phosphorolytic domain 2 and Ribosomal protein S5 domain 2-type fold and PNPase/RNase PH domain-containing protein [Strongyloides ratti]|uniref:Exoribonuclease, phosphorolytic domain 1 and Exoribonuclease, phosphorolytic domain 2 and Ribosomal protein S5 domain 2-type fold and PNPase/RNase PH domain-containing protein n=1 Tax=Strongyloides ratti TaxID=34506 RepID=A0A090L2I6_STRRB|nr:Exoribonuclease, phosphorolytic domain 1 and Exoribonuclease, phosphorolytic domain 2 and Ribosomal protein S5 domain 2-type fold and PNPase/RNase PH domain-containing protein [Strongyloides ratti]CEF63912.1 Exoribonuclease, phosphorolytic domain 1 and Exoribonuclease, phosphorolytic domain 2 and Ribosomal protein S5 domain 2-type fold and PNPase/RNase PH domain-containing protein [Strongyloides ratti]